MPAVITLIAKDPLLPALSEAIRRSVNGREVIWLRPGYACDIFAEGSLSDLRAKASGIIGGQPVDMIVQPAENRRKKLLLADMDSTVVTGETLDELAEYAGVGEYVAQITARSMNGEIDFEAALIERVALLKDLPAEKMDDVWQKTELSAGAKTTIQTMKKFGAHCILISGGFTYFTERVADACGFDQNFGNHLEIINGNLTGNVIPPIVDRETKLATLEQTLRARGLMAQDALTVGDGANDVPMLLAAGLGVAYRGKPNVQGQVIHQLNHADLTGLLYAQGYKYDEFVPELDCHSHGYSAAMCGAGNAQLSPVG